MSDTGFIPGKILQEKSVKGDKIDLTGFTPLLDGDPMSLERTNERINAEKLQIDPGSAPFLDITGNTLRIKRLAVVDIVVDTASADLAAALAANYSNGDELQAGDLLIVQNATGGTKTYQHIGTSNGDGTDFILGEKPDLEDAYIRGLFSGQEGLNYNPATGSFSLNQTLPFALGYDNSITSQGERISSSFPIAGGDPIPANRVRSSDQNGQYLVLGVDDDGIWVYDKAAQTGKLINSGNPPANGTAPSSGLIFQVDLFGLNGDKVYARVNALQNVYIYDIATDTGTLLTTGSGINGDRLPADQPQSIHADGDYLALMYEGNGLREVLLYQLSTNTGTLIDDTGQGIDSGDILQFAINKVWLFNGELYIAGAGGVWTYNIATRNMSRYAANTPVAGGTPLPTNIIALEFEVNANWFVLSLAATTTSTMWVYNRATNVGLLVTSNAGNGDIKWPAGVANPINFLSLVGNNVVIPGPSGGAAVLDLVTNTIITLSLPGFNTSGTIDFDDTTIFNLSSGAWFIKLGKTVQAQQPNEVPSLAQVQNIVEEATSGLQKGIVRASPTDTTGNRAATGITFDAKPKSGLFFLVLGASIFEIGDADINEFFYVSRDGGNTALAWTNIEIGDELYFNGGQAGFDLSNANDRISIKFSA